jgi:pimeloyl-ACP methyl ester carboxylesterase
MRIAAAFLSLLLLLLGPLAARASETGMIEASDGVRLYYERIGDGPETVIVPGGFLFGPEIRRLAKPERSLIVYDMRNRGRSSRVEDDAAISIQADIADLETVRHHFDAGRMSLVGYSYLGLMTALYALDHPERVDRLVQIGPVPIRYGTQFPDDLMWRDPVPVIPPEEIAALRTLRDAGYDRTEPREFCLRQERLTRRGLVGNPAHAERIDVERRCEMPNEWPVNLRRHLQIHFTGSVQQLEIPRDALRALGLPVLTIHGTMDRNAPFAGGAEWAMTLPNARLLIVRGAAHQVWIDHPDIFEAANAFLAGAWPQAAVPVGSWDDVRRLVPGGLSGGAPAS